MGILERLDEVGKMLYPNVNYCMKLYEIVKVFHERNNNTNSFNLPLDIVYNIFPWLPPAIYQIIYESL